MITNGKKYEGENNEINQTYHLLFCGAVPAGDGGFRPGSSKPPAEKFMSVVVYDPQTRSELQTSQPYPSKNNKRDKMIVNDDGSIDLYFGPEAPAGKEANWLQTVPGKGWFCLLRLYSPTEAWYDKTWQPGEIELID